MSQREAFIVGAARTPVGSFQGALSGVPATKLGAVAISAALVRAKLAPDQVDETFMGNVLSAGIGQAPARQAAIAAGITARTPATTISKVCGSGLAAIIAGSRTLVLGENDIVVAGGMESMSGAPYLLPKARQGYRMGHGEMIDSMLHDGLWDPYGNASMGVLGEKCASEYGFTRAAQDEFARESYRRALAAQAASELVAEIAPVTLAERGGERIIDTDEEPGRANLEKMGQLKPAFAKDGTITAANASKINDGAAALVLASGAGVERHGLTKRARIVAWAGHAQAPEWFTTAPIGATKAVLARAGLSVADMDLFEINEAFAVVAMACAKELEIPLDRVNVRGGAIAFGHPIGASGARIVVTLLHALEARNARRGLATLCIGGGEALAVIVERV